ncbi:hypothetical protein [Olleya namhaensis]|uniref:hypothetical protein n=1 Tax=Olleya namhaensis TaxID=1144750 RepID=UPI0024911A40|nr:hypothetical protein [Olleya namhaensis]
MKTLELNQMETLNGGTDCEYHISVSAGLMAIGIATAFTGVGALFLLGGAAWGFAASESDMCAGGGHFQY